MKLRNNFSTETRWLFFDMRFTCFNCGGNGQDVGGLSLHHIRSRISESPLNAIVLCNKCHLKIGHTQEEESKYLIKTIKYLLRKNYIFKEEDLQFYRDNIKLYDKRNNN